jgi:type I restriction enzyme R subunit
LAAFLTKKGHSKTLITKTISDFKKAIAVNTSDDLYQANKEVYSLLRYGMPIKEEAGQKKETIELIGSIHVKTTLPLPKK